MTPAERLREIAKLADSCPAADYATGEVLAEIVRDAHALADWLDGRVVVKPVKIDRTIEDVHGLVYDSWVVARLEADPFNPIEGNGKTFEEAKAALQSGLDQRDGRVMP